MIIQKRFYMVRHGQTVDNAARIMAGQHNSPLTDLGRAQARTLPPVLESLAPRPVLVAHSPLTRAKETAEKMNATLNLPMTQIEDLQEQHMGEWEGAPYDVCYEQIANGTSPPGGETHPEFTNRVVSAINQAQSLSEDPVIITCHGGFFRAFARAYGLTVYRFNNCHIYEYEPDPENAPLPWRIFQHDLDENGSIHRRPAEKFIDYCRY